MWEASENSSNPWRLFRLSAALRNHTPSNHEEARKEKASDYPREHYEADDTFSTRRETDYVFYRQYDDNANANIIDKFAFYGRRKKSICDKQTQTDMVTDITTEQKIAQKSAAKKIIYSKSCESVVKKPTAPSRQNKSFDDSNKINKNKIDEQQTIKYYDNNKMLLGKQKRSRNNMTSEKISHTSLFPKGIGMTDGFNGGNCYDSSPDAHEYMSSKEPLEEEFCEVPKTIEQTKSDQNSGEKICSDLETNLRNMSCRDKVNDSFINQWSPFHQSRRRNNTFYDYRQPDEISLVSERSCYSTSSEEVENEYEIVDWSKYDEDYKETEFCSKDRPYVINAVLNTPILDLSALDGYHTAPNSPDNPANQWQSNSKEYFTPSYYDKDVILDFTENHGASKGELPKEIENREYRGNSKRMSSFNRRKDNMCQNQNVCCKCGKPTESTGGQYRAGIVENRNKTNNRNIQYEIVGQDQRSTEMDLKNLSLDTPPFLSVNSLHYEADPETGKAKVVGRGSFGQVYKARFSDPMFNHLPIVIKEFDEEFTNSKEIIEEAKRLNYLQDTGYVPVCYGLLCFGSPIQPKYGIVQEYVGTGLTLEQMLWDQYELPLEFWFRIAIQCCEGLASFHDKGILLNDIKTNNILLEFAEHSVRIRYIDFGLATDMRGKRYKNTRSLEDFVYLAPEVRKHGKTTTVASDIFSLGYILEQIKKYTGVNELMVIARLCMERDPDKRLPPREAARLLKDHMARLGYDPMFSWEV